MTQKSAVRTCFAAEAWNHAEDLFVGTLIVGYYRCTGLVWNLLSLVDLDGLDMWGGWKEVLFTKPGGNGERRGGNSKVEVVRWGRGRRTGWVQTLEMELRRSQERNGGSSLRRSGPTQGRSTNVGRRRCPKCRPRHVLALLVPRADPDGDEATGWTSLLGSR